MSIKKNSPPSQRRSLRMDTCPRRLWKTSPHLQRSATEELAELIRFRHFKRYYLGCTYDWERLDLLVVRRKRVHVLLRKDIAGFKEVLRTLAGDL